VTNAEAPRALALLREVLRTRGSKAAAAVLLLFVLVAVFARYIAPFDPTSTPEIIGGTNLPPSTAHLFGTDPYSRDVLSRVIWGAQLSLAVAAGSVLLAVTLGAAWGAVAGFAGGWLDAVLMRVVDAVLSVPRLLLLIVLVASRSEPLSVGSIILLLGLTGWPGTSRIVRAEVRSLRQREFVLAARAIGVPPWRILLSHVMPGVVPQVLVAATLAFATVIPLEAGLSFLGLGVPPPTPSWGNIIFDGADHPADTWWLVFFPGLAIVCTVLAVNAIGDRLREAADPRQLPPR
jgi:peptide/nickel transport system permease protein